jgi:hypothetical protein
MDTSPQISIIGGCYHQSRSDAFANKDACIAQDSSNMSFTPSTKHQPANSKVTDKNVVQAKYGLQLQ